jgi:hypothetical protein
VRLLQLTIIGASKQPSHSVPCTYLTCQAACAHQFLAL